MGVIRVDVKKIALFRYIKIQPQTIDLSTLREVSPPNSLVIPRSLVVRSIVNG